MCVCACVRSPLFLTEPLLHRFSHATHRRALTHVHQVLKHELSAQPALGGVGVLGLDAALPRVVAFVRALQQLQEQEHTEASVCACICHRQRQLYFAAVDVERCYDHIRPQGLLTLLRGACLPACMHVCLSACLPAPMCECMSVGKARQGRT